MIQQLADKTTKDSETRLRILYLYQLLLTQSDEDHHLTTKQIQTAMQENHGIYMHRTTVSSDIALLRVAGFDIIGERKKTMEYYLAERTFSIPDLKILIDAVQSARFITAKKSRTLVDKLTTLTSETSAEKLKRTLNITDRVKTDNEKGYYIIDAIHEAMNAGVKLSFLYFDLDGKKKPVLKNDGNPYTVSPYDLIWDGDFYYLVGFCDERNEVRIFRVDRIKESPILIEESMKRRPRGYKISRYTQEAFRMYASQEAEEVTLQCENDVMKFIVDHFGSKIQTRMIDRDRFRVRVKVCPGPTLYRWIFGFGGQIKILGPENVVEEYKDMLQKAIDASK